MKVSLTTIIISLITLISYSKDKSYKGWIQVNGEKINFAVQYKISSNNLITGTSLTGKGTSDETKCKIRGKYNPKKNEIYFYETVVISSKAKYENLNFCLLSARLKHKTSKGIEVYSGAFTGSIRGTKKKCASGSMRITKKIEKTTTSKNTKPIVKKTIKPKIKSDTLYSNIKSKKSITYRYKTSKVALEIWDDIQADGDRVSIYLDGKKLLNNYELTSKKKRLEYSVSGTHYLKIVAENEGKAAPNTSRVRLHLGNQIRELTAHIKTKDYTYIKLKQ